MLFEPCDQTMWSERCRLKEWRRADWASYMVKPREPSRRGRVQVADPRGADPREPSLADRGTDPREPSRGGSEPRMVKPRGDEPRAPSQTDRGAEQREPGRGGRAEGAEPIGPLQVLRPEWAETSGPRQMLRAELAEPGGSRQMFQAELAEPSGSLQVGRAKWATPRFVVAGRNRAKRKIQSKYAVKQTSKPECRQARMAMKEGFQDRKASTHAKL